MAVVSHLQFCSASESCSQADRKKCEVKVKKNDTMHNIYSICTFYCQYNVRAWCKSFVSVFFRTFGHFSLCTLRSVAATCECKVLRVCSNPITRINVGNVQFCKPQICWNSTGFQGLENTLFWLEIPIFVGMSQLSATDIQFPSPQTLLEIVPRSPWKYSLVSQLQMLIWYV